MDLPDEAYLAAMVAVPGVGPAAMVKALDGRSPAEGWDVVRHLRGAPADAEEVWQRHLDAGIAVLAPGRPGYPEVLHDDPDPPAVLFARGDLGAIAGRRVAIVGTRRASRYGLGVADQLGHRLGVAEVAVVSGLALGIDGAAHEGLLRSGGAPPIGVVASGLDVVYPRRHRRLWERVAEHGLLLSEAPLGVRPDKWRFPARNRIIAALAELVVVVESNQQGGSLYTAEDALDRDRPLFAVPGPITSPAARGTNRLIADGATPLCAVDDIFLALGLTSPIEGGGSPPEPGGVLGRVLDATAHEVVSLETLVTRTGLTLPEVAVAIDRLCRKGWLVESGGRYERAVPAAREVS